MLTGYLSLEYARSLAEFGEVITLAHSGIHLLKRDIDGVHHDLCGLYPYSMASDWSALALDLESLREGDAVSLVLVTDPFAAEHWDWPTLAGWDVCRKFKTHQMVDLRRDWRNERKKGHRYLTRRALAQQCVEVARDPTEYADLLWQIYRRTIKRFGLMGIQRMSAASIAAQLEVPGATLVISSDDQGITGAILCFDHDCSSNGHLAFLSDRAEKMGTSYALYHGCLDAAEQRQCRTFNFGSAAGTKDDPDDGLFRFKRRWANHQAETWLCGMILDEDRYAMLNGKTRASAKGFFPGYRNR